VIAWEQTGRREARERRRSTRAVVNYAQYRSHILIYVKRAERAPDQITDRKRGWARRIAGTPLRPIACAGGHDVVCAGRL
jgi:hypothetical protein